ncbi:MAG: apolipoprotein N-acyltransferase [Ignavibacteriae bacterium]|nr:apolipoprotein N-acyltransferase [Ignavibacteriota bacterium]
MSFPPIQTGVTAFVGITLLLFLMEKLESYLDAFRFSYVAFFLWHIIVGYWAGGFTHGRDIYQMLGGAGLLLLNPFFYLIPIAAFQFIRRYFSFNVAVLSFPFCWIGLELFRAKTELALPWLTLGNTQTYNLSAIQFASFTGVYGVSFWILCINICLFFLIRKILKHEWKLVARQSLLSFLSLLIIFLVPYVHGFIVLQEQNKSNHSEKVRVALIQPNIDPFEKWKADKFEPFLLHREMTRTLAGKNIDLVLWSETAIPFYLLHRNNQYYLEQLKEELLSAKLNLVTGVPDIVYYSDNKTAPSTSKHNQEGKRYENFNGAILLEYNSDTVQRYHKKLLVPFAERVPFSDELNFLNAFQWDLGLGGWGRGKEHTVFQFQTKNNTNAKFSTLICFESIFPGFVTEFVRNGAQFLTIITIDSWWGKTSGAYQHLQYSVFRAIENRRWLARCATGGISCIIDPFGNILEPSELFTRQITIGEVELRHELTFYTRYGDWFATLCIILASMFIVSALGKKYYLLIRTQQEKQNEIY